MIRKAAVAGQFYSGEKDKLREEVKRYLVDEYPKENAISVVCPHAGFMYSGRVAGAVYGRVNVPERVVLLGPNHTGAGKPFAISKSEGWETPLGVVEVDSELSKRILRSSNYFEEDDLAHRFEHSLEVQLPFLQSLRKELKIVAICISHSDERAYQEVGEGIAVSILQTGERVLVVASTDMTHYEPKQSAEEKDREAISCIVRLDEEGLLRKVKELSISMCGYVPTYIAIVVAKKMGAKEARLVRYSTSGEITGDYAQVVGYAGVIIK